MSETQVDALNKKVDRILTFIDNDSGTGRKGLAAQIEDLKVTSSAQVNGLRQDFTTFVGKYNMDQAVKKGKNTVWNIVFGIIGGVIAFLGKALLTVLFKI